MSFTEPQSTLGSLGSFNAPSPTFSPGSPILPSLPDRMSQLMRKYQGKGKDPNNVLNPALADADPATRAALLRLDLAKVGRGSDPYTATESALGLRSAGAQAPITPEPEQSFFNRGIGDLSTFIKGIPHLPGAVASDVLNIPDSISALPGAMAQGDTFLQAAGNVANLPGFRLIPGSFILGAAGDDVYAKDANGNPTTQLIAGGGLDTLAAHPLFTALDALPFASKAAKMTGTYKGVEQAMIDQARLAGTPIPRSPRPIPTLLKNLGGRVESVPDLRAALIERGITPERGFGDLTRTAEPTPGNIAVPGPLGRGTARTAARFQGSALGRWVTDARSSLARTAAERGLFHTSTILDPERAAGLDPTSARVLHDMIPELRELGKDIAPERMAEINRALVMGDETARASFSPQEQAYVQRFTDGQADLRAAQVAVGEQWFQGRGPRRGSSGARGLLEVEFPHGTEVFDARTGAMIRDARYATGKAQWFQEQLGHLRSNTPYSLSSLKQDARAIRADASLPQAQLRQATSLLLERARQSGIDVSAARTALNKAQTVPAIQSILDTINDRSYAPPTVAVYGQATIDSARNVLATLRTDPKAAALYAALSPKALQRASGVSFARQALSEMMARRVHGRPPFDPAQLREALNTIDNNRKIGNALDRVGVGEKHLNAMRRYQTLIERRSMPARYDDLARATARDALIKQITDEQSAGRVNATVAAEAIDAAGRDYIARVEQLMPGLDVNSILADARNSWLKLAENGLAPQWVHRVSAAEARKSLNPRIFDNPNITPGQLKARLWDPVPSIPDLTISLHHQAYEMLNEIASRNFANEMSSWYGISGTELQSRLMPLAEEMYVRNPSKPTRAHLQDLIDREYVSYDPATFLRGKGQMPRVRGAAQQTYIPRTVADTLDRLRPTLPSTLERGLSGPMRVFRTSVLPLSPRWHLNNIIGGAIMLGSIASPRTFTYIMDAYRMAKAGGEELARIESPTGRAAMPPASHLRDMAEWQVNRKLHDPAGVATAHSIAAGSTLGRVMRQAREARISQAAGRGFNAVTQASYDFNGFIDNMNRSMAYLTGRDRAISRGLTREEAIDAGIQTARDALQSWDRLTPIERSGIRMVFPFYSWTSHLLRFVTQYPHDHPWRVAVMSRVAETELTDMRTGLPERFAAMFTPFGIDAAGNAVGVTLDSANPFRDVTNYGMLAGFLIGQDGGSVAALTSGMNPFIGTVMEAAGFDAFRGSPDLYPDLTYDPNTGQLSSSGGGPLPVLALNNFLPQSEYLTSLAGMNRDFKTLARRDPEAAARQLRGALGIPNLIRKFNVPEETIKAEVTRYNAFRDLRSEALRTGDLGLLDAYPVLAAYRQQIEAAGQSGQLAEYQPASNPDVAAMSAYAEQIAQGPGGGQGGQSGLVGTLAGLVGF